MNFGEMITNVLIQQKALEAATSGDAIAIVVLIDYICLLLASILALAVILERAIRLRRSNLIDQPLIENVPVFIKSGDMDAAINLAENSKTIPGRILQTELKELRTGLVAPEEAMETADAAVSDTLHANLDILETIAKIAPLLGLLGTVLGMMFAFGELDLGTRKETLAHGITAALDTTVRGLIIAIVCLAFERHFQRRIDWAERKFATMFTKIVRANRTEFAEPGFEIC